MAITQRANIYLPVIPIIYPLTLIRLAEHYGVAQRQLLDGIDIEGHALSSPHAHISILQFRKLIAKTANLIDRPGLGILYGIELDLEKHGLLAYTLGNDLATFKSIKRVIDYFSMRIPLISFKSSYEDDIVTIRFIINSDLGDLRSIVNETVMGSFYTIYKDYVSDIQYICDYSKPSCFDNYKLLTDTDVYFGGRVNQVCFKLPVPIDNDNFISHKKKRYEDNVAFKTISIAEEIKKVILRSEDPNISQEQVALTLGYSPRTCRRLLQSSGSSFSEIKDNVLKSKALIYLKGTTHSVDCIAKLLGYSDKANFRRAFKRWTGRSPSAFR